MREARDSGEWRGAEVGTNERQEEKDRLSDHNDIQTIIGRFSEVEFIIEVEIRSGEGP